MKSYDVVIVGGGAVGASVALAFGQCSRRVLLVEKNPPSTRSSSDKFNQKTLALSYSSIKIYEALGIRLRDKATPIERVHVTMQGQWGSCYLDHRDHNVPALGYVIGVNELEEALLTALQHHSMIERQYSSFTVTPRLILDKWETQDIQARLLIASDGAHSSWRASQFIGCEEVDYHHCAVAVNFRPKKKIGHLAIERFLKNGAIAILPWQEGWVTCVWTLQTEEAQILFAQPEDVFIERCEQALGKSFGKIDHIGKRVMYPLRMKMARTTSGARFLLMGNAAHSLHPIAAQGLNLSLRDVWQLRLQLRSSKTEDVGDPLFLEQYCQAREREQARVIFATDKIATLMASERLPSRWRAMGITLLDMLPLKHRFTRYGMGLM